MPNWLHRTDVVLLRSVAAADLPEAPANYIEEPDLSAVQGEPTKYWIITGDVVTLADAGQQAAIDSAEQDALRDQLIADKVDDLEDILRAFAGLLVDELNILRNQFNTTTAESPQLTDTTFTDRTLAQVRAALRSRLGS